MSSPLAGALMMTFWAPAAMCALAFSAFVKMPVLSSTMSTPRSPHGRCRRVLLLEDPDLPAVNDQEVVGVVDDARVRAVRRIVLEQERVEGDGHQVVDRDNLDVGRALDQRLERLAADAAKTIDANAGSHRSSPIAIMVRRIARDGGRSTRVRVNGSPAGRRLLRRRGDSDRGLQHLSQLRAPGSSGFDFAIA